jgi:hypothetical protein
MGCCSNKNCGRQKEAMLDPAALITLLEESSWAVKKLLEIAKSGARIVGFKNTDIDELAAVISAIAAENKYLKNLLGIYHPGKADTSDRGVTITFGPDAAYTLFIPAITSEARTKLANSLTAAAEELKNKSEPILPEQKWLPFVDCAGNKGVTCGRQSDAASCGYISHEAHAGVFTLCVYRKSTALFENVAYVRLPRNRVRKCWQ